MFGIFYCPRSGLVCGAQYLGKSLPVCLESRIEFYLKSKIEPDTIIIRTSPTLSVSLSHQNRDIHSESKVAEEVSDMKGLTGRGAGSLSAHRG